MANKVGPLIREARTQAGLSQEALAKKVKGLSANDISLAERGEKELTQALLKEIAKATGVTQKSLIDAAKKSTAAKSDGAKKSTTAKSGSAKSSGSSGSSGSSNSRSTGKSGSSRKSSSSSGSSFSVSAEEKKLIKAYREADTKVKAAVKMLLGTEGKSDGGVLPEMGSAVSGDLLGTILGSVRSLLG